MPLVPRTNDPNFDLLYIGRTLCPDTRKYVEYYTAFPGADGRTFPLGTIPKWLLARGVTAKPWGSEYRIMQSVRSSKHAKAHHAVLTADQAMEFKITFG